MSIETSFQQLREANPVPDPMLLTEGSVDLAALLITTKQRSTEMQTQELTTTPPPPSPPRRPWRIAVAAAAVALVIGASLVIANLGGSSVVVDETPAPTTTVAPPTTTLAPTPPVDIEAAAPTQVQNDQASRAIVEFAGNAQAVVEGGAHRVEIQMYIEPDFNDPGTTVRLVSVDGEITSTGITDEGVEYTPTWTWTPDGDKVVVLMVGRGVGIPDTRPDVTVTVQATPSSDPVEFILTTEAGSSILEG
jgi:hypothetical protein